MQTGKYLSLSCEDKETQQKKTTVLILQQELLFFFVFKVRIHDYNEPEGYSSR